MKHPNLYKIEKYIILICIFSIPLHGIVTNYMRHNPALWNHFFHEYNHIFFYDYMSLAMIIAFGSFIGLVFQKRRSLKNRRILTNIWTLPWNLERMHNTKKWLY